jgi:hypothetical protein
MAGLALMIAGCKAKRIKQFQATLFVVLRPLTPKEMHGHSKHCEKERDSSRYDIPRYMHDESIIKKCLEITMYRARSCPSPFAFPCSLMRYR